MKMKEFGPGGGRVPGAPLGSANGYVNTLKVYIFLLSELDLDLDLYHGFLVYHTVFRCRKTGKNF